MARCRVERATPATRAASLMVSLAIASRLPAIFPLGDQARQERFDPGQGGLYALVDGLQPVHAVGMLGQLGIQALEERLLAGEVLVQALWMLVHTCRQTVHTSDPSRQVLH